MKTTTKFAGALLSALLVPAAASAAPALSGDLQKQAVAMRYVACLTKAAQRYDDRISDASVIAVRIMPLCTDDFAREEAAYGQGLSGSEVAAYQAKMNDSQSAFAIQVVLDERAWSKKQRHPRVAESQ